MDARDSYRYFYANPNHQSHPACSLSYLSFFPEASDSYAGNTLETSISRTASAVDAIIDPLATKVGSDPLGNLLKGKREFLSKSVEDVLGLIYEREEIKSNNIRTIDYDSCRTKARLFEIGSWQTGADPQLDKTRGNIERELLGFEREKRFEEVACWRDMTRLKSELREVLREFDGEKRKEALLEGDGS